MPEALPNRLHPSGKGRQLPNLGVTNFRAMKIGTQGGSKIQLPRQFTQMFAISRRLRTGRNLDSTTASITELYK